MEKKVNNNGEFCCKWHLNNVVPTFFQLQIRYTFVKTKSKLAARKSAFNFLLFSITNSSFLGFALACTCL